MTYLGEALIASAVILAAGKVTAALARQWAQDRSEAFIERMDKLRETIDDMGRASSGAPPVVRFRE